MKNSRIIAFFTCLTLLCAVPAPAATKNGSKNKPSANAITMPSAVERALKDNPGVSAVESGAKAAEEGRKSARGSFGPALSTSYGYAKAGAVLDPKSSSTKYPDMGTYVWNINVRQPLFRGFALLASYQKAALEAERQKFALLDTRLQMTQAVQIAFLEYLRTRENVRSAEDALARLRDQLKITKAFFEVGLRPRLDVLQAEVDVSRSESELIQITNARDTIRARLSTLLGLPADTGYDYVGKLDHQPFTRTLAACLESAYAQRPDLVMAEKAVSMAEKDRTMVQSDYYPQVDAYYGHQTTGNTPDMQRMGGSGKSTVYWEAGVQATWNVFEWGKTYYADQQYANLASKVKHEAENLKLEAGYEVKSRYLSLIDSEKRIAVAKKGLEQAVEAYNVALARYQAQVGTNFDVLDASSKLTAAEASLTSARADYLTSLSRIYAAMGELRPNLN